MTRSWHRRIAGLAAALAVAVSSPVSASGWTTPGRIYVPGGNIAYSATIGTNGTVRAAAEGGLSGPGLFYVTTGGSERIVGGERYYFESAITAQRISGHTRVRVAWVDTLDRTALWLTRDHGGSWLSSRVWIGTAHDVAMAPLGDGVAIAFRDGKHRLRYLTWDATHGPSAVDVVAPGCCRGAPSLVVKGHTARIAFAESAGSHRVRLASGSRGGTWSISTVDTHDGDAPSVALRADGTPVLAYERSGAGVWWAWRHAGAWSHQQVFPNGYIDAAIAADSSGRVVAVADGAQLKYRRLDVASSTRTLARVSALHVDGLYHPVVGLSGGKGVVTFASFCGCAGDGGGIWLTRQE